MTLNYKENNEKKSNEKIDSAEGIALRPWRRPPGRSLPWSP